MPVKCAAPPCVRRRCPLCSCPSSCRLARWPRPTRCGRAVRTVLIGAMTPGHGERYSSATTVQFFQPVRDIARIFAELQSSQAAAERVISLLETEPDICGHPRGGCGIRRQLPSPSAKTGPKLQGDVEFKDVSFRYKRRRNGAGTTFQSEGQAAGQTIALVGETGSGKSTIVNLVCRFYEPTAGEHSASTAWTTSERSHALAAVAIWATCCSSPHLFSGTIARQHPLSAGRTPPTRRCARAAQHGERRRASSASWTTAMTREVGEGGNRLSTGQKQLISFARAHALQTRRIFVLDEATCFGGHRDRTDHPARPFSHGAGADAPASSSLTACPRCALPTVF